MTTTAMTSPPNSVAPSISSIDPQLLKLLARHHQQLHQQPSAKEFLQHAYYFNHPPPNTVATNLPRHLLGNGLSKLNTENSLSNLKLSSSSTTINGKIDSQQSSTDSQLKKPTIQQSKEALNFDQWLQPPLGSMIQRPPCLAADTSSSSSAAAGFKSETVLSSGMFTSFSIQILKEKKYDYIILMTSYGKTYLMVLFSILCKSLF
jgi:hypothetical protein